jgi:hypothetical protein
MNLHLGPERSATLTRIRTNACRGCGSFGPECRCISWNASRSTHTGFSLKLFCLLDRVLGGNSKNNFVFDASSTKLFFELGDQSPWAGPPPLPKLVFLEWGCIPPPTWTNNFLVEASIKKLFYKVGGLKNLSRLIFLIGAGWFFFCSTGQTNNFKGDGGGTPPYPREGPRAPHPGRGHSSIHRQSFWGFDKESSWTQKDSSLFCCAKNLLGLPALPVQTPETREAPTPGFSTDTHRSTLERLRWGWWVGGWVVGRCVGWWGGVVWGGG